MLKLIDGYTGIFFGGGDQLKLSEIFSGSKVLDLMITKI
jgi:cyanophycinase-like exopeptidase